jgi:hypothetical protein
MFDHVQIIQGGVPVKYLEVLKKQIIPPDNEEFYTIRVHYNDGVNRTFSSIPKVMFEIYIKTLLAEGHTMSSLRAPARAAARATPWTQMMI